jgi:tetratricopeptide (TPR) repeat protein
MRSVALFLLLCACTSLASDEQKQLADHQRNALLFFDGGRLDQAMGQVERGLELAPGDYKLNSLKGGILLLRSGNDRKRLDEATAVLAEQFDARPLSRHEPHLLLNYALAQQKQGLRHLGEAVRLEGQVARVPAAEVETLRQQAAAEREQATTSLRTANDLLGELVQRGELLRVAHNHRMQIALQLGDEKAFRAEAELYFEQARRAELATKERIEKAKNVDFENAQLRVLKDLHDEEIGVRTLVAEFLYARKQHQDALVHLNRVLELDPRRFVDYFNRGKVLLELGRIDEAKSDFRRFLADPTVPATSDKAAFALKAIER